MEPINKLKAFKVTAQRQAVISAFTQIYAYWGNGMGTWSGFGTQIFKEITSFSWIKQIKIISDFEAEFIICIGDKPTAYDLIVKIVKTKQFGWKPKTVVKATDGKFLASFYDSGMLMNYNREAFLEETMFL